MKDVRDKVVIATKMGVSHNTDRSLRLDSSPATIRRSLEKSLERLGMDYVDLYYPHHKNEVSDFRERSPGPHFVLLFRLQRSIKIGSSCTAVDQNG